MRVSLFVSILTSTFMALQTAQATPYSGLYVFGDSLVDSGNVQIGAIAAGFPDPAPASSGYFNGRFSNGPNYVDLLNQRLFSHYSSPSLLGGNNYAFGGALARNNGDLIPDLAAQVGSYFTVSGGTASSSGLYIINVGGNDLFEAAQDPTHVATFQADTIATITAEVTALNAAGARNILVTGLPNVGGSPVISGLGPAATAAARQLSVTFNSVLQGALDGLVLETGTNLFRFDYISFFDTVNASPTAYGLPSNLNTTTPCITAQPGTATPDCTPYAFFDDVHPEARFQNLVFGQVAAIVGVPEPQSISLLGLGVCLAVVSVRRRRR